MKSLKYILIAVLIIIMIYSSISCSDNSTQNQKPFILESTCKTFPKELLSESGAIMTKRLSCLNLTNFTVEEDITQSQVIFSFDNRIDNQILSDILTAQGKMSFVETFKRQDVLKSLHDKLSSECARKLDSLLGIGTGENYPDAIIGKAVAKDTFAISKFFRSKAVRSMLPLTIKFSWSRFASDSNRLELYALSNVNSGIDEKSLGDVRVTKDAKCIAVSMTFKKDPPNS